MNGSNLNQMLGGKKYVIKPSEMVETPYLHLQHSHWPHSTKVIGFFWPWQLQLLTAMALSAKQT